QVKKYVDANKDKIKAYKREWYQKNKDRIKKNRESKLKTNSPVNSSLSKIKDNKVTKAKAKVRKAKAQKARELLKASSNRSIRRPSLMEEIQIVHRIRK